MLAADDAELAGLGAALGDEASRSFRAMFATGPDLVSLSADVRYVGQAHELEVPVEDWARVEEGFHAAHRQRFGFDRRGEPVEVVNVRVTTSGSAPLTWGDLPAVGESHLPRGKDGVWLRKTLPVGFATEGPATVVEDNSATRLEQGDHLTVLGDGTLEIALS